jgi:single-strand DNA-binding protein
MGYLLAVCCCVLEAPPLCVGGVALTRLGVSPPTIKEDQVNAVQLTGRLTQDPELREAQGQDGQPVVRLRLAVDRMGRGSDPGFINVTVFGNPAQAAARVLSKGWLVAVSGRLHHDTFETRAGAKRSQIEVIGSVEFLSAPKAREEVGQTALAA